MNNVAEFDVSKGMSMIFVLHPFGEVVAETLFEHPLPNTGVTIKETAVLEGYTTLPSKVVNTGSTGSKAIEVKLTNSDYHVFKIHKTSSVGGRNLRAII